VIFFSELQSHQNRRLEIKKSSLEATWTGIDSIIEVCFLKIARDAEDKVFALLSIKIDEYNNEAVEAPTSRFYLQLLSILRLYV